MPTRENIQELGPYLVKGQKQGDDGQVNNQFDGTPLHFWHFVVRHSPVNCWICSGSLQIVCFSTGYFPLIWLVFVVQPDGSDPPSSDGSRQGNKEIVYYLIRQHRSILAETGGKNHKVAKSDGPVSVQIIPRIISGDALAQPEGLGEPHKIDEANRTITVEIGIGG